MKTPNAGEREYCVLGSAVVLPLLVLSDTRGPITSAPAKRSPAANRMHHRRPGKIQKADSF